MVRADGQRGLALIELVLAMALTLLLAVWAISTMVDTHRRQSARADAVWMLELRQAVLAFLQQYRSELVQASEPGALSAQGYDNWQAPQLQQLRNDGLLPLHLPIRAPLGDAEVRVLRQGDCPSDSCGLVGLIYSKQQYRHSDGLQVDESRVAEWLMATEGLGGHVPVALQNRIKGSAFDFPNPPWPDEPALPAGTLVLTAQTSQQQSAYLRVRDDRDPDFQGPLTVAQTITAKQGISIDGLLKLNTPVSSGSVCLDTGALARTEAGELLSCRDGQWSQAGPRRLGAFSINSLYGCFNSTGGTTANPVTHACSCPSGAAVTEVSDSGPQPYPYGRVIGFVCVD